MAKDVSNFIRITVPASVVRHPLVAAAGRELAEYVGGSTSTESFGTWYDEGKPQQERVFIVQFNFSGPQFPRVEPLSRKLVDALFAAGERAVFKERNYNVNGKSRGYRARILYPETNPIPDEVLVLSGTMKLPDVLADDTSMRHIQLNS